MVGWGRKSKGGGREKVKGNGGENRERKKAKGWGEKGRRREND